MTDARPLAVGAPDGHGRFGVLDRDPDGRLICHECGRTWLHLATHVAGRHGLTAEAYRARHGLPRTLPLVASTVQDRMRAAWTRHAADHLAALDTARDPAIATAASLTGRPWAPAVVAHRQSLAAEGRVDLTPEQIAALGDASDIARWVTSARALMAATGVPAAAIARACGLATGTVSQRLRRYP